MPFAHRSAMALDYPTRPVQVIVGQAAASSSDITARLISQYLSQHLGQQFVVEVRPGATGNIATELVVRATPDGYTLLLVNSQNTINAALFPNLPFDFVRDIAPIAGVFRVPLIMEVLPNFPAQTVPEFIKYAKANPGKINMASAGVGGPQHVAGELFKFMAGLDLVHVPLSRLHSGNHRYAWRAGPGHVRCHADRLAAGQVGQASRACGYHARALGHVAERAGHGRIPARLRSVRLDRFRRAKENADRDRRLAQQVDQ
jgi:hypothetical protein